MPPKRPRGCPRLFDETRRHVLCQLISIGFGRNEACRQVGVKPSSVIHAVRTYAAFASMNEIEELAKSRQYASFRPRRRGGSKGGRTTHTFTPTSLLCELRVFA